MSKSRELDFTTKIVLIILVVVVSYLILFSVLSVLLVQDSNPMGDSMENMMGTSQNSIITNLVSLSIALIAGVLVSLWLKTEKPEYSGKTVAATTLISFVL